MSQHSQTPSQPDEPIQTPLLKVPQSLSTSQHSDTHQCEYCDKVFRWKSCLDRHVEISHQKEIKRKQSNTPPEQVYISNTCDICEKIYSTLDKKISHMETAHQIKFTSGETPAVFQCMFCNEKFINSQQASIHMMNFHKEEHNRKYEYFASRLNYIRETYKQYDNVNYYPVEKFLSREY